MNLTTKVLVWLIVALHALFFLFEAVFWGQPSMTAIAISKLNGPASVSAADQIAVLRVLFINQGFYNLFLACSGVVGLVLINRGDTSAGRALLTYMCLSAIGAGIVLATTTTAYAGAFAQAAPAIAALVLLLRSRG